MRYVIVKQINEYNYIYKNTTNILFLPIAFMGYVPRLCSNVHGVAFVLSLSSIYIHMHEAETF